MMQTKWFTVNTLSRHAADYRPRCITAVGLTRSVSLERLLKALLKDFLMSDPSPCLGLPGTDSSLQPRSRNDVVILSYNIN